MSSARSEAPGRRWTRTLGFRLNAWYVFVLITGLVATYLTVALLTGYAVKQADRQVIIAKLEEYRARFESMPLRGLDGRIPASALRVEDEPYLLRVVDRHGDALFTHLPSPDLVFDEAALEVVSPAARRTWTRVDTVGGEQTWTVGATPLSSGRYLQIGMSSEHSDRIVRRLRETLLLGFLPLLGLGLVGGAYLTRRALLPIRDLASTMRGIETSKDLSARAPVRSTGDELDELSELFNRMMAAQEQVVVAMRESIDNVAHDLRTPLTRLRSAAETALAAELGQDDLREALADCLEESDRVGAMLKTLVDISEAEAGIVELERAPVALDALTGDVIELYEYVAEERGVAVTCALEPDVRVLGDEARLFRAAANLLDNALKYTPSGRSVKVTVRSAGADAELEIADEGPGIDPDDIGRIWDRLYRADRSRSEGGLGLGLSFVRAIVEAHGGMVDVSSDPGRGSCFVVRLPLAPDDSGAAP